MMVQRVIIERVDLGALGETIRTRFEGANIQRTTLIGMLTEALRAALAKEGEVVPHKQVLALSKRAKGGKKR